MADEVENMFYVGETPWHGLGIPLKDSPKIEEAIQLAGLNWNVRTEPLFREIPSVDGPMSTPGFGSVRANCVIRESDGSILADHVGPNWTPLQNNEAFGWFQPFLDQKLARLECAGSLRGGKRVFVLARLNLEDSVIVGQSNDVVRKFILLSNGHDGVLAVRVGFTPIRVVCANTLAQSHDSKDSGLIRVFHSKNVKQNVDDLRDVMNVANQQFEASAEKYRYLASKSVSRADLKTYIKIVFQIPEAKAELNNRMAKVIKLYERGFGNDLQGIRGTWWAAYNAVTEHLSYERGRDKDQRLDGLWFGQGRSLNRVALNEAVRMAS